MKESKLEEMIRYLVEHVPKFTEGVGVTTSIGTAIAVMLLLQALQLYPSTWKMFSVLASIISSMFFLSSTILYPLSYPGKELSENDPQKDPALIAGSTMIVFAQLALLFLGIGLVCFVGAEKWWYAVIALIVGLLPLGIFCYFAREMARAQNNSI